MKVVETDIARAPEGAVVAHQVNCRNKIGAGVSGAICRRWPGAEQAYHDEFHGHTPQELFGNLVIFDPGDGRLVAHIFSQLDYGNSKRTGRVYTDEDKLRERIQDLLLLEPDRVLYLPHGIGCGLAGGDWTRIKVKLAWAENAANDALGTPGRDRIVLCRLPR